MNWTTVSALISLAFAQPVPIPMPPAYRDANVVVSLRPVIDADLDYFGLSLTIRTAASRRP
jgi:hypothetical protein